MIQYQVIADPQIFGVFVGDILQRDGFVPYEDITSNLGAYVAVDLVENNPQLFQLVS